MSAMRACCSAATFAALVLASPLATTTVASAQAVADGGVETVPVTVEEQASYGFVARAEGALGLMATGAYRDRFELGGAGALRAGLFLFDGHLEARISFAAQVYPVSGEVAGTLYQFSIGARGALPMDGAVGGPFIDFDAGAGVTGNLLRFVYDVGIGWAFRPMETFEVGPVIRYTMIRQSPGAQVDDHAHLLTFGVELGLRVPMTTQTVTERIVERQGPEDRDADGVMDDVDQCPDEPEDSDGLGDGDGCPEHDHDDDGVHDDQDQCPSAAESMNGHEDEDGCPDTVPEPVVAEPQPELLEQRVQFRTGSDNVSRRFNPAIREVCAIAEQNPGATIRVVGHADETGTEAGNQRLAAARVGAVTEALILVCGLSADRIETYSFGDVQVTCTEDTRECHQRNRRAEFYLVRPVASAE